MKIVKGPWFLCLGVRPMLRYAMCAQNPELKHNFSKNCNNFLKIYIYFDHNALGLFFTGFSASAAVPRFWDSGKPPSLNMLCFSRRYNLIDAKAMS